MSHRVTSAQLFTGTHVVSMWGGLGIPGAQIPAAGGSPLSDDGIVSTSEYRMIVVTQPSAGALTFYPDTSSSFSGAPDGAYPYVYQAWKDGVSYGTATEILVVDSFSVVESASALDSASAVCVFSLSALEAASADSLVNWASGSVLGSVSEALSSADSPASSVAFVSSAAEAASSASSAGVTLATSAASSEITSATEFSSTGGGTLAAVFETAAASDTTGRSLLRYGDIIEYAYPGDTFSVLSNPVAAAVEAAFASDSIGAMQFLNVAVDEHGNAIDLWVFGTAGRTPPRRVGSIPAKSRFFRRMS